MSNDAINWALTRPIRHSTAKFVLVILANCADSDTWEAWPSIAHIVDSTGQDRKTVLENIKRLVVMGYITDTEQRKGATKQVPVFRLNEAEKGTVEESQKRNSPENGTVPKFPINSPKIPYKQSQNSAQTVPKTGYGTIKEPSIEPKGNHHKEKVQIELPDWLPAPVWQTWVGYRKSIKAELSQRAAVLCISKLEKLRAEGSDPEQVIDQSIMSGKWTGLFAVKKDTKTSGLNNFGRSANAQQTIDNLQRFLDQNP